MIHKLDSSNHTSVEHNDSYNTNYTEENHASKKTIKNKIDIFSKLRNYYYLLLMILLALSLSIVLLLSYKVSYFIKNVTINSIEIHGASIQSQQIILKTLNKLKGQPISKLNLQYLQTYLLSIPSIAKASVYRNMTGKVKIFILEKNPYFLWLNDSNNYKIVDSENKLIKVKLQFPVTDLIKIESGEEALKQSSVIRFLMYKDINILKQVDTIIYKGYYWDIILKNTIVIKLPIENVEVSYTNLVNIINKYNLLKRKIEYIDARIPNKIFIMPRK
jgi:cell division protein FtsQ